MRLLSTLIVVTSALSLGQPHKPLKPLTAPREATVKVVWFKGKGENATGGTSGMKVRLAPNKSGEASVGVMEEFAGSAGDQWRMATWQAAIGASAFNRVPMTDYEFLVRVGGHIDGPSAGLLTTATFVALQRGKALKPNTTMTGTINPDGSSGPVGGIAQKMRGAAADGITRFGFPIGGREQLDVATGERVDLLALARELKLEAKELRTINEAYEFLTGEALPAGQPLAESEMEFSVDEAAAVKLILQQAETSYSRLVDEALPWLKQAEAVDAAWTKQQLEELGTIDKKVKSLSAKGDLAGAYWQRADGIDRLIVNIAYIRFWMAWREGDFGEITRQLSRAKGVFSEIELLAKEVDSKFAAGTLVNDLFASDVLEDGFSALVVAARDEATRAQLAAIFSELKAVPEDTKQRNQLFGLTARVLKGASRIRGNTENARRFADAWAGTRPTTGAVVKAKGIISKKSETALYASGIASLAYLDALVTSSIGAKAGLSESEQRAAFAQLDAAYQDALTLRDLLKLQVGSDRLRFVIAYRMHFLAASLNNQYYALGASPPEQNGSITVENTRALATQLDLARQGVLESCQSAKQLGWVPFMAKVHFSWAVTRREGDDASKLYALQEFWLARFWCDAVQGRYR
ncbi:MAG: S16 family serine protease [Myxococcales bacterium]|nr:S16 family serine protease [Myxococcales bacterium]MDP3500936.1 S16 family serine protease [Myxococcales bacterium]